MSSFRIPTATPLHLVLNHDIPTVTHALLLTSAAPACTPAHSKLMGLTHVTLEPLIRNIRVGAERTGDNKPLVVVSDMDTPAPPAYPTLTSAPPASCFLVLLFLEGQSRFEVGLEMLAPREVFPRVLSPGTIWPSAFQKIR